MLETATQEQTKLRKEEEKKRSAERFPWRTKEWKLERKYRGRKRPPKDNFLKQKLGIHWHHMMKKIYYWGA